MAYTATLISKTVHGNQRVAHFEVAADAASGTFAPGMSVIDAINYAPISMASASEPKIKRNLTTDAAASNGSVYCLGFTNGDVCFVTVYGR